MNFPDVSPNSKNYVKKIQTNLESPCVFKVGFTVKILKNPTEN